MTPEGKIVAYLTKQAKAKGFAVRKLSYEGRHGAPDRLILAPGVAYFVEVKAPGMKPRPEQEREMKVLTAAALNVIWLSSQKEVDYFLTGLEMESFFARQKG